jgi:Ca-activated chloride channel homolog
MRSSTSFLSMFRKPLLFGLCGAIGCLLAALLLGEPLLYFTKLPPSTEKPSQAVAVLIDCSGSMDGSNIAEVKTAASNFIKRQDFSRNKFVALGFGNRVHTPTALGASANDIEQGIAGLADGGGTNMAIGIDAAVELLQPSGQIQAVSNSLNRGILLFTDGKPDSTQLASTSRSAMAAKAKGINLVAVATGDADLNYLAQLTGDRSLVFPTNSGQFDQAFQEAEKRLYSNQLIESGETGQYGLLGSLARTGSWTGLLAVGTSLALIFGQNRYMRRRALTPKEFGLGSSGGFVAGIAAGAIGQLLFIPATNVFVVSWVGKILSGTIAGALGSTIASVVMPKLPIRTAFIQGSIAGTLGAIGYTFTSLAIGDFWTNALAFILFIILIKSSNQMARICAIALAAAVIAQFSFLSSMTPSSFGAVGRVAGWIILGLFLGGGMSAFIPNLQFRRALLGGGIGGFVGGIMFMLFSGFAGDLVGRLVGAAALGFFIGLMIALLEQLVLKREALLIVHWSKSETTRLALGTKPILLGSSSDAHVPLPRTSYPDITAKIYIDNQEVILEFDEAMKKQSSMKVFRHVLKNGERRRFGEIDVEVQIAGSSA